MKRSLSSLLAFVLVAIMGLTGCNSTPATLTGNYTQDTLNLLDTIEATIALPQSDPNKLDARAKAKSIINDYAARYRRDPAVASLPSFTTMQTVLNSVAAQYSYYPKRPFPEKLKTRLEYEFRQVRSALKRGS